MYRIIFGLFLAVVIASCLLVVNHKNEPLESLDSALLTAQMIQRPALANPDEILHFHSQFLSEQLEMRKAIFYGRKIGFWVESRKSYIDDKEKARRDQDLIDLEKKYGLRFRPNLSAIHNIYVAFDAVTNYASQYEKAFPPNRALAFWYGLEQGIIEALALNDQENPGQTMPDWDRSVILDCLAHLRTDSVQIGLPTGVAEDYDQVMTEIQNDRTRSDFSCTVRLLSSLWQVLFDDYSNPPR